MNPIFKSGTIELLCSEEVLISKINVLKAYVFDWDGVFTNGEKDHEMQSKFNEIDSMGTNLLRFSYYLKNNHLPFTAIISGENNKSAFTFTKRECFHSNYFKINNKIDAALHICSNTKIQLNEIMFVFDDVLDLSLAAQCGLRIFVSRPSCALFTEFVIKNNLADIIIDAEKIKYPIRFISEFLMSQYGIFDDAITQRTSYSDNYKKYIELRKATLTSFFTITDGKIKETVI